MRLKYLLGSVAFFCLICLPNLYAQDEVVVIPNDIQVTGSGITCQLYQPGIKNKSKSRGVEIANGFHLSPSILGKFDNQQNGIDNVFHSFRFKLTAPVINKEEFKFLIGLKYLREKQIIDGLNATNEITTYLNNNSLNRYSFSLIAVKPINKRHYFAGRTQVGFSGDIRNLTIKKRYIQFNILGTFGVKASEDLEYGFGLVYSRTFKNDLKYPLPFVILNKNFTSNFGIESVLPSNIKFRYNLNEKNLIIASFNYNSSSYHLKRLQTTLNNTNETLVLDYASILGKIGIEKQIKGWLWMGFDIGYIRHISGELYSRKSETNILSNNLRNQPYVNFALFLSPPKEFLK